MDPIERVPYSKITDTEKTYEDNKYYQLVEDIKSNELPLIIVIGAIRQSIRENKNIPDGIKDLLCGQGGADSGYIVKQFQVMKDMIGKMELAYRRGADKK